MVKEFKDAQDAIWAAEKRYDAVVQQRCPVGSRIVWMHGNHAQYGVVTASGSHRGVRVQNNKTRVVRWVAPCFIVSVNGMK
jgi:hypothetical protein